MHFQQNWFLTTFWWPETWLWRCPFLKKSKSEKSGENRLFSKIDRSKLFFTKFLTFFPGQMPVIFQDFGLTFGSFWGHFRKCSFKSEHKSPENGSIRVLLRKMWKRRLSTREHPKVPESAFFEVARKMVKNHREYPLRSKMAILARLQLGRVLLVWAENYFGSSLGRGEALTQFSAQSDSTRRSWSLRKIAEIDFFKKWSKSDF